MAIDTRDRGGKGEKNLRDGGGGAPHISLKPISPPPAGIPHQRVPAEAGGGVRGGGLPLTPCARRLPRPTLGNSRRRGFAAGTPAPVCAPPGPSPSTPLPRPPLGNPRRRAFAAGPPARVCAPPGPSPSTRPPPPSS